MPTAKTTNKILLIEPDAYQRRAEDVQALTESPDFIKEVAAYSPSRESSEHNFSIVNGVAMIPITGNLTNRGSFFSYFYNDSVVPNIKAKILAADADYSVDSIVLAFDCPGGSPDGLADLSKTIKELKTPIVGFCDGMVASGAYWIASALDALVITPTAQAGSIGVISIHTEIVADDKEYGITRTVFRAGKYKALGNMYEKLSDTAKTELQGQVDGLYDIFLESVAENKGITIEEVQTMADGRVYMGQDAVDIGLADKVGFLEDAIEMALNNEKGGLSMAKFQTVAELKEACPELCAQIEQEAQAGVELPDVAGEVSTALASMLALAVAHFGKEDGEKFQTVVESGVTAEQYASIAALTPKPAPAAQAPVDPKAAALAALEAGSQPAPGVAIEDVDSPKDFMAAVEMISTRDKITKAEAVKVAAVEFPKLRDAQANRKGGE